MPRRATLTSLLALLATLLFPLLLTACVSTPLRRPVILGASASAGLGAEVEYRGRPTHVDLESVLRAEVARSGCDPVMLADPSFYVDPDTVAREQIEAAAAVRPTLILAVDYLFWSVYGARFNEPPPATAAAGEADSDAASEQSAAEAQHSPTRLESLDAALATLDRFDVPIVVGDIPDVAASADKGMPGSWIPAPGEVAEANERLAAWASQRANVVLLPISKLVSSAESDAAAGGDASDALLQDDHLHPTVRGLVTMCQAALKELEARGLINPADYRADEAEVLRRLPLAARRVENSRRAGPMAIFRLIPLYQQWEDAIAEQDCDKAARLGGKLFEEAATLRTSPHDMAGAAAWWGLSLYYFCPDAREHILRWREQLRPKVFVSRPDPWPLELWAALNDAIDDDRATLERLLQLRDDQVDLAPYEDVVGDLYVEFIRSDPVSAVRLIDLAIHLPKLEETGRSDFERSRRPIKPSRYTKMAEESYTRLLELATTDDERHDAEQHLLALKDPAARLELDLRGLGVRYAELERALRAASRIEDAEAVRRSAEQVMNADRYAAATAYLEREIAREAAKAKAAKTADAKAAPTAETEQASP